MIAKTGVRDKSYYCFFSFLGWGETEYTGTSATIWPIVPAPNDDDDDDDACGVVGGMKIGRRNQSTER
jgi:hypothetical protein